MKRILLLFAVVAIAVFSFAGCSGPSPESGEPQESAKPSAPSRAEREANIADALSGTIPGTVVLIEDDGVYDLTVAILEDFDGKLSDFGNYVLATKDAFEAEFSQDERGDIEVYIEITQGDGSKDTIKFKSKEYADYPDGLHGTITDDRTGSRVATEIESKDDLFAKFPAAGTYDAKSELDPDDVAMYDEVMDILNSDWSRSEDEILEEIAPQYGMTAAELKQFLTDMMDKIY